jgi:hypothetical protein
VVREGDEQSSGPQDRRDLAERHVGAARTIVRAVIVGSLVIGVIFYEIGGRL